MTNLWSNTLCILGLNFVGAIDRPITSQISFSTSHAKFARIFESTRRQPFEIGCVLRWSISRLFMRNSHEFLSPQDLNSYDSLLKSGASFDGRKAILRMSHGFLPIRKTVAELACERLAKHLSAGHRTGCTSDVNKALSFVHFRRTSFCHTPDFLTTNSRSRIAEEIADIIKDARKP